MKKIIASVIFGTIVLTTLGTGIAHAGPSGLKTGLFVSPLSIPDPDRDDDGLTGAAEAVLGTSDDLIDSDGDGYSDYFEVWLTEHIYGCELTDPANADVNANGIVDAHEESDSDFIPDCIDSNPSESDTNENGIIDGHEDCNGNEFPDVLENVTCPRRGQIRLENYLY